MNIATGRETGSDSSLWIQNLVNGLAGMMFKVKHSVFCDASPFQKVEVLDTYGFGRVLLLGGSVVLTEKDEFIYNEMIVHPAMLMHSRPRRVCIIGGGDGGALREVLKHDLVESVTVVEIDALVVQTVKNHFPSMKSGFADTRAQVVNEDGRRFLEKSGETYDVIIVDTYDPGGPVQSITSEPFFRLVNDHLASDGVAVFQTDSPTLRSDYIRHTMRNVSPIFAQQKPYVCTVPSFPEGLCSFLIASKTRDGLNNFAEERYTSIAGLCRCYNREVHTGAFLLPRFVRNALLS
jgi:spermidine synthase